MNFDAVLKVGGSLTRVSGLPALCREISIQAERHSLLIVPGGGDFAEQVRKVDLRFRLEPTAAHIMALLAMDQYGYLLNQLIGSSCLTADLVSAHSAADSGRAAIFLPSAILIKEDPLPHSWSVTSDSIAAWIANRALSRRLILLKDVDGLLTPDELLIHEMEVDQLREHAGGVDEYLSKFLSSVRLETWVISGLRPDRLSELLGTTHTIGTRIRAFTRAPVHACARKRRRQDRGCGQDPEGPRD